MKKCHTKEQARPRLLAHMCKAGLTSLLHLAISEHAIKGDDVGVGFQVMKRKHDIQPQLITPTCRKVLTDHKIVDVSGELQEVGGSFFF